MTAEISSCSLVTWACLFLPSRVRVVNTPQKQARPISHSQASFYLAAISSLATSYFCRVQRNVIDPTTHTHTISHLESVSTPTSPHQA